MKSREVISGIVSNIEKVNRGLSFVTLEPLDETGEWEIPIYMTIDNKNNYIRKPVDIVTERSGFLGRHFKQTISSSNSSFGVEMPYSLVKQIRDHHRRICP